MVSLAAAKLLRIQRKFGRGSAAADTAARSARQGRAILEVAKTLLVRAEIAEHLGDHDTAEAILEEVGTTVRGCADAGIDSTLFGSAERGTGVTVTSRNDVAVVEELTPKELEVLRLLPTRLSRREIGARLYVSLNTVKTHQRAVYRKLGVEHRSAAVSRARELGLL